MANKLKDEIEKRRAVMVALESIMADHIARPDAEGNTHPYDRALSVLVALEKAGFSITRKRQRN